MARVSFARINWGKYATGYYRCAALHNRYLKKSRRTTSALSPQADSLTDDLLARHARSCLRAEQMEEQLQDLIEKLVIPIECMKHHGILLER